MTYENYIGAREFAYDFLERMFPDLSVEQMETARVIILKLLKEYREAVAKNEDKLAIYMGAS